MDEKTKLLLDKLYIRLHQEEEKIINEKVSCFNKNKAYLKLKQLNYINYLMQILDEYIEIEQGEKL